MLTFTIKGQPVTKKNSQRMVPVQSSTTGKQRMIPLPSKQYEIYKQEFSWQLKSLMNKNAIAKFILQTPINFSINLKCVYYMGTRRKVDLVNLLEATCDILVDLRIIEDDNCTIVAAHDGSRVLYDKDNPRVEIQIEKLDDSVPSNLWNG